MSGTFTIDSFLDFREWSHSESPGIPRTCRIPRLPGGLSRRTFRAMAELESPTDLKFNRGLIADPDLRRRVRAMDGGMSYASVQAAIGESANIVSTARPSAAPSS